MIEAPKYSVVDLADCSRFVSDAKIIHEWDVDPQSEVVSFQSDANSFSSIKSLTDFFEAVLPEDRETVRQTIESMLRSAQLYHYECRVALVEGEVRWISVHARSQGIADKVDRLYGFTEDITERKRAEAVTFSQNQALKMALNGASLSEILTRLAYGAEEQAGECILASFWLLDADEIHLKLGAAPSFPVATVKSMGGLAAGPLSGSASSAAFFGAPFIATDIEHDHCWDELRHLFLPHGLISCWSMPLISSKGRLLGTMAFYRSIANEPNKSSLEVMSLLANTASVIMEQYRKANDKSKIEQRFRSLVDATNAIIWTTTPKVEVVSYLPGWGAFTGQTLEDMKGMGWVQAIHPDDAETLSTFISRMRTQPQPIKTEAQLRRVDGEYRQMVFHAVPIFDEEGVLYEWAGSFTDISDQKESEKRLHHLAMHDALTGLPNRAFLNDHLQKLLDFTPENQSVAVMLLDLDRFKQLNDSMGHAQGDMLLCEMAQRLKAALPSGDLIARLGGDEFVVVAHAKEGRASAQALAHQLIKKASLPIDVAGNRLISSVSIGVSLYPEDGRCKDILVQYADIAMYKAKGEGGNRYRVFSAEMSIETKNRMALEIALRGALERQELVLHYQPRVSLPDEKPLGVEALIRWVHPERGLISPLDFIPIAEETGLIDEIGLWVLTQACADMHLLSSRLALPLRLSVNMSPKQLLSPDLAQQVLQVLEQVGMSPHLLELELTEGAFIHDLEGSAHVMHQLKALGVQLAVDDFGTGHAGISYLRRFPLDVLKLDRTFVAAENIGQQGYVFIKAVTEMAHALGLYVVAEGVEDKETLDLLKRAMCDEAQGYLFARPLPLKELEHYFGMGRKA